MDYYVFAYMLFMDQFVFLFIWAFDKGMKTSKKNWARAVLILWLIGIPALLIIIVMFGLSLGVNS